MMGPGGGSGLIAPSDVRPSRVAADEIGVQSVVNAINLAAGDGNAGKEKLAGVRDLKLKLVKQLTSVEKFAYEQQKAEFLPAGFSGAGYCAPGVVPRPVIRFLYYTGIAIHKATKHVLKWVYGVLMNFAKAKVCVRKSSHAMHKPINNQPLS